MPIEEIIAFVTAIAVSGIVSGLLAGVFGIGGGAVLVPVFYQMLGILGVDESVRMHVSVGSSLAIIIPTSLRSFQAHHARGVVDMDLLKSFLIPVPAGVVLASLTAAYLSSGQLRGVFAAIDAKPASPTHSDVLDVFWIGSTAALMGLSVWLYCHGGLPT